MTDKIQITDLQEDDIERLRPLAERTPFVPYPYLKRLISAEGFTTFNLEAIRELLRGGGQIFAAEEDGEITGFVSLVNSPWESNVLGKKMGELAHFVLKDGATEYTGEKLVRQACAEAKNLGLEFLMSKANTGAVANIHGLEKNGFLLMDTIIEYIFDIRRAKKNYLEQVSPRFTPSWVEVRPLQPEDSEALMALSKAAFNDYFGRFHADPRIPHEDAIRFYEAWVRGSIEGYADWIDVATSKGEVGGIIAWRWVDIPDGERTFKLAHCPLTAVEPKYQARGLFNMLAVESMRKLLASADFGMGPTHVNNFAMQRGLLNFQWWPANSRFTFHKWLD